MCIVQTGRISLHWDNFKNKLIHVLGSFVFLHLTSTEPNPTNSNMSEPPQSPCHWCVDVNGDFSEVSDLLFSEETRRETLARVSSTEEWRHLQQLFVQVHYKGVTLSRAMDRINAEDLPAVSPPASPSQSENVEEEERYFGEDWVLYGSFQPQEILQEAIRESEMYSQDRLDM